MRDGSIAERDNAQSVSYKTVSYTPYFESAGLQELCW